MFFDFCNNTYNMRLFYFLSKGHAGHDDPPSSSYLRQVPDLVDNEKRFDLNGQIAHKVDFIEHFVPNHVNIKLIGHSEGCWMLLKLLKQRSDIKSQVKMCYLLFPDIGGRHNECGWGDSLFWRAVVLLLGLFFELPDFIKLITVTYVVKFLSISPCFVKSFLKNIYPTVIEKVEFLKRIFDKEPESLDQQFIKDNVGILKFYCAETDKNVIKLLEELVPKEHLNVDQLRIGKHFTIYHSFAMADQVKQMMITNWIIFLIFIESSMKTVNSIFITYL